MKEQQSLSSLQLHFNDGQLIAYPTEAVYGLGCDPDNLDAIRMLLELKQRPIEKGLILVANTYSQLLPYVKDSDIPMDKRTEIFSRWPGPITWLLPKSPNLSDLITGRSALVAVRVSNHPVVKAICQELGKPIISTSANLVGHKPATTAAQVTEQFADKVMIIEGEVGDASNPSTIINGLTGEILRA
jgi:L-threonylcarbamoyladenylate synthase